NVLVALAELAKGSEVVYSNQQYILQDRIPGKHKFAERDFAKGDEIIMYGVLVGRAQADIPKGGLLSTLNVKHASSSFEIGERKTDWHPPDISKFQSKFFYGYH